MSLPVQKKIVIMEGIIYNVIAAASVKNGNMPGQLCMNIMYPRKW